MNHTTTQNPSATNHLSVQGIEKSFTLGDVTTVVLDGASLEIAGGQSLAIVGPSGSGKSTLMQIIGGLDDADGGVVRLNDDDVTSLGGVELAKFRNRRVGFVFQDHHLLPQLSVLDNVLIPVLAFGKITAADRDRAAAILDSVGLSDRLDHRPSQLSGGQRERVAIARALIMQPTLILADEPTGNLDRRTADQMTQLLINLPARHDAILIAVTHDAALASRMDRQLELVDGKLNDGKLVDGKLNDGKSVD